MNVKFTTTARAHFQTIRNSFVKFHKGCHQRVRGVARISYALSINFVSIGARKQINDLVKMRKERERCFQDYTQRTCTPSDNDRNICKVSKRITLQL